MAIILVKNSLNNSLSVRLDVNLHQLYKKSGNANPVWLLGVATTAPGVSGVSIPIEYSDELGYVCNVDSLIADSVSKIASKVDWGELEADYDPPYVYSVVPEADNIVPIESNVYIDIKDDTPSAGIDLTNLNIKLDTGTDVFDITDKCVVEGTPFYYKIKWNPPFRNYCTYDGG